MLRTFFVACASSLAPLTSASAITRRHVRRLKHLDHGRQRAELRTRDANTPCVSIFTTIATLPGASAILASHLHHVRTAVLTRASATRARPIPSAERACRQPDRSTGYRAPIQPHRAVLAPPERRIIATNLRAGAPFLGTHATQRNTALDASDRTAGARTDARKKTLAIDRAAFSRATSRATLCRRRAWASKDHHPCISLVAVTASTLIRSRRNLVKRSEKKFCDERARFERVRRARRVAVCGFRKSLIHPTVLVGWENV